MTTPTPATQLDEWQAVIAEPDGYCVTSIDNLDELDVDVDDLRIVVVRASAAPFEEIDGDGDGFLRLPGIYTSGDLLIEFEDCVDEDELRLRWGHAQAMTAGLNADLARTATPAGGES